MPVGTLFVDPEWYSSTEGKNVLAVIMYRISQKRKSFGLLEKPFYPPTIDTFEYKIFVSGKSGVGKTSTIAKLSANRVPQSHSETPGIQTSTVYWPAKVSEVDKVILFKLHFWDAGENALKKFDHIMPACMMNADGVLFLFSFTDKPSFNDLPHQITRVINFDGNATKLAQFVIGTKLDLQGQSEVSQRDVSALETNNRLKVLGIRNPTRSSDTDIDDVAPVLNYICDQLWQRDKILAGKLHATPSIDR